MKKITALVLAVILMIGLLTGCGSGNSTTTASATEKTETEAPAKVVVESLYFDAVPRDLTKVEEAINAITVPAINVEVELYPLGFMDAATQVSLMITSGGGIDLVVCAGRSDFLSLVNNNMLMDLSSLLENYGSDIKKNAPNAIPGGYVGDKLYGIPSIEKYGRTYGLIIRKDVVDSVGWTKTENLTMDDMSEFLEKAHAANPDINLIQLSGGGNSVANFEMMTPVDYLGADAACGGMIGIGKGQGESIVNIFATEEYKAYVKKMREWYLAGYFNADAATQTESNQSFVTSGASAGYWLQTELDMVATQSAGNGVEMIALNTRPQTLVTGDINNQTWSIPYNCKNPEAAMKLLNMMWGSEDLINTIYYGVEGLDYRYMDDNSGRITYLEGETAQTCGYHQWFGLYGDTSQRLVWDSLPADFKAQLAAFNNNLTDENRSRYLGYAFNPDVVKTQYAAVNDVISTYRTSLECGVVDPDKILPEFLQKLEAAGISEIIAENQKELDNWIAANK